MSLKGIATHRAPNDAHDAARIHSRSLSSIRSQRSRNLLMSHLLNGDVNGGRVTMRTLLSLWGWPRVPGAASHCWVALLTFAARRHHIILERMLSAWIRNTAEHPKKVLSKWFFGFPPNATSPGARNERLYLDMHKPGATKVAT